MKKFVIIFLLFGMFSCTDRNERDLVEYKMIVKNETNQSFILKITSGTNEIFNQNILPNNATIICSKAFDNPVNSYSCALATAELRFPNNKGYRCSNIENGDTTLCLNNDRNFLGQIGYVGIGNNSFEFKITQVDYDNAFILP